MKKFATLALLIVTILTMLTVPALASQPDYSISSEFDQYDTDQKFNEWEERLSERGTAFWYKAHGLLLNWYIESIDNHQYVLARRHPYKKQVYALHTDRIDFIEFGKLYQAESEDEIETVKQAFEKDPVDAAVKFIFPVESSELEGFEEHTADLRKEIEEKNIPIYWNVKTMTWDPNFYVIEVAIGKYVIQSGDTLTGIAEKFDTTVEELLRQNYNIDDQNHIEAGNYLCIW